MHSAPLRTQAFDYFRGKKEIRRVAFWFAMLFATNVFSCSLENVSFDTHKKKKRTF